MGSARCYTLSPPPPPNLLVDHDGADSAVKEWFYTLCPSKGRVGRLVVRSRASHSQFDQWPQREQTRGWTPTRRWQVGPGEQSDHIRHPALGVVAAGPGRLATLHSVCQRGLRLVGTRQAYRVHTTCQLAPTTSLAGGERPPLSAATLAALFKGEEHSGNGIMCMCGWYHGRLGWTVGVTAAAAAGRHERPRPGHRGGGDPAEWPVSRSVTGTRSTTRLSIFHSVHVSRSVTRSTTRRTPDHCAVAA